MTVAVLMAVYQKDRADFLDRALQSLSAQTYSPDSVVLVKDGPLTDELCTVIEKWRSVLPLTVQGYGRQRGLAHALNFGLGYVQEDLVCRMDSDDISLPQRIEKQKIQFEVRGELLVLGTGIEEFYGRRGTVLRQERLYPRATTKKSLSLFKGTPLAHPTVMMRTEVIKKYRYSERTKSNEDLDLWFRMLSDGIQLETLQEPLLEFRITDGTFRRRSLRKASAEMRLYVRNLWNFFGPNWRLLYPLIRFLTRFSGSAALTRRLYFSKERSSLFKEVVMKTTVLADSVFVKGGHVFEALIETERDGKKTIRAVQLDSDTDCIIELPSSEVELLPLKKSVQLLLPQ